MPKSCCRTRKLLVSGDLAGAQATSSPSTWPGDVPTLLLRWSASSIAAIARSGTIESQVTAFRADLQNDFLRTHDLGSSL